MKKIRRLLGILLLLLLLYLVLWPIDLEPKAWDPPQAPALVGMYAQNEALKGMAKFPVELGHGPEDVAMDSSGYLYAGLENGTIIRTNPDGSEPTVFANTGGRPLGMEFDSTQQLIVADASKGLLSIDNQGFITVLADSYDGEPFTFADDLDIAADGTIYFSDVCTRASWGNYKDELMEHSGTGRLFAYSPTTKQTTLLLDSLQFANGVAVSPDQRSVVVVETGAYRIQRYWLEGPKKGKAEMLIENLPGFPDGVSCNGKDTYWVAIANPRNATLDMLLPYPFLRKIVKRLPEAIQPKPVRYSFVLGLDLEGNVVHNLQDPDGGFAPITSVEEMAGKLYIGSLSEPYFGSINLP